MSDASLDDSELVRLVVEPGEARRTAELALCERYGMRVRRYAERHLRNAQSAADLTQLVLLSVIEALREGRIADPERLGAFVLSTCRHLVWDENRAVTRQTRLRETIGAEATAAEPTTASIDLLRLEQCVRELPRREQRVVLLTYGEEWSSERIAAELGTTAGNVRVLRHRALARLTDCMEDER
ncbi:MAG TPA: sigma-70 family RNA polymerase sigma factor [Polyangiaceae bacterium]|nr:sigma-70 family RNA polymerase sigma factor [Polyangiaceae bacterium]